MNKRGSMAGILIVFAYIVLASLVFIVLFTNVQSISTGTTLVKNAMLKDSAFLFDAVYLVDGSYGKKFNVYYEVPSSLVSIKPGDVLEDNRPDSSYFSMPSTSNNVIITHGELKNE